ncbi:MAG: transposase [Bacilli bacterium]
MAETSLSRLQKQVDTLSRGNLRLREANERITKQNTYLKSDIKHFKEELPILVQNGIEKAYAPLLLELKKLKEDNEHMKRILNHNSDNTGIPTSKTKIGDKKRIPNSREKSDKSKGGQKGHSKHKLEKFEDYEITDTYTNKITPLKCGCGGKLKLTGKRCKDDFDIEIRLVKRRNEFCEYTCNCCGKEIKVPIPNKLKEENQYGSNAQALALSLVNEGYVSFKRTRELISGFTGMEMQMSEGYISKLQKRCYNKLKLFEAEILKKVISQKILCWDDTGISINGKNACLRFYGTDTIKYYKAHEKKDKEGIDEDGILKLLDKETVVMHDHNKVNYNDDYDFTNAECCVHLIRDLKELNGVLPRKWIEDLISLLVDTNNIRKDYIDKSILFFDQEVSDKVIVKYDEIIEEATKINKEDFNQYNSSDEKTLIKRLVEYKENYLLWVLRFDVPFSNNLSERSLRGSKTKMKVSGQFANIQSAVYFARIKSYIETCKANGLNSHMAFIKLIEDEPYTIEEIISNTKKDDIK